MPASFPTPLDAPRRTYGFAELSLVPGELTIDPTAVSTATRVCGVELGLPIIGAAMDALAAPAFAQALAIHGGLAVVNAEGLLARHDDPDRILAELAGAPAERALETLADAYAPPVDPARLARRLAAWSAQGAEFALAATPAAAPEMLAVAEATGARFFLVQSQVASPRHVGLAYRPTDLGDLVARASLPVAVGNVASARPAYALLEQGAAAIFVGIGPGAACTTREVLGIGVPQASALADAVAARDAYAHETGRRAEVVADGGIRRGGEIAKALALGADAVMIGSPLARAQEAPGGGTNWGMAAPSASLPRGTRISVGTVGSLARILVGPARVADGSENLGGALRAAMAALGAADLAALRTVELVYAPAIGSEGKSWQQTGS